MNKILIVIITLLLLFSLQASSGILALIDPEEHLEPVYNNSIAQNLEIIFNYWGFDISYHFLDTEFPSEQEMQQYSAVLCNFHNNVAPDSEALMNWLLHQHRNGKKIFMWGDIPLHSQDRRTEVSEEQFSDFYQIFGLQRGSDDPQFPIQLDLHDDIDTGLVNFERNIRGEMFSVDHLVPSNPQDTRFHRLIFRGRENPGWNTVIASWGDTGAFIQSDLTLFRRYLGGRNISQLYLDLFRIVGDVFDLWQKPVPDLTTLMGRQVLMAHIDGDGVNSLAQGHAPQLCGEVIRDEILFGYPELLFGVSFIVDTIDPQWDGTDHLAALAREIYRMDNVEPASHTFHHPFNWLESRYYFEVEYGFDSWRETTGSIEYLNTHFAPKDKPVEILYWSGNCLPSEEDIANVYEAGYLNLNGGRNVTEPLFPSVTQFSPISRKIGPYRQIFAPMNNEMLYTNLWTGPFWGYKQLTRCLETADGKYRLKPINLYFHFYSAEYPAALEALKHNLEWAVARPYIPVYPAQYCRKAMEFFSIETELLPNGGYQLKGLNNIQSLRVENGAVPELDDLRILGYFQDKEKAWIHLQPGTVEIILNYSETEPRVPFLIEGNTSRIFCIHREEETLMLIASAPLDSYTASLSFQLPTEGNWSVTIDGEETGTVSFLPENRVNWNGILDTNESIVLLQKR